MTRRSSKHQKRAQAPGAAEKKAEGTATDPADASRPELPDLAPLNATEPAVDPAGNDGDAPADGAGLIEPPAEAIERIQQELAALKDRHLRVAAEYDNFRKRTARERADLRSRAQAEVVTSLLDALDDLGRVSELDPKGTSAGDVIKGVELVERKLLRHLEDAGLEKVGELGEAFDPNVHEAVGSLPAETEQDDHTVGAVFQPGYKLGATLLRPARVQVKMWTGGGSGDAEA